MSSGCFRVLCFCEFLHPVQTGGFPEGKCQAAFYAKPQDSKESKSLFGRVGLARVLVGLGWKKTVQDLGLTQTLKPRALIPT